MVRNLLEYLNVYGLLESISGYARARSELVKSQIKDEVSAILSRIIIIVILFFASLFLLLFASLTLSNYLNVVLSSRHMGYGIVTLFYLLVLIALFFIKNISSIRAFLKNIASKLFSNLK